MKVIVVGGGIGGLTMALSVHQAGVAVRVYEAVPDLAPLGVGINLQPTAVRELTELGLGEVLARTGIATNELSYFNKFGQLIYTEKRGLAAGYKWPQYSIHRGQLQLLLLQAVRERIGNANFRSGLRFVAFMQDGHRVTARFFDSRSGTVVLDEADVLVGADGIHSAVRRQVHPKEGEPRFAQQLLWRAAVDAVREARCEVDQLDAPGEERSRASVVKATSISRLVSALSTWTCSPMARAPADASLTVDSEVVALEGLTSTATRVAAGTISRRSSRRFAANSFAKLLVPVTLPPGWARLATRPSLTGSSPTLKTMGIVVVAALAAAAALFPNAAITATRW